MNIVLELVWTNELELVSKNLLEVLRQVAELVIRILEFEVRQLDFVDEFLAYLRADWDPNDVSFTGDFFVITEFSCAKSHVVKGNNNKFTGQPGLDLLFRLADAIICCIITFFKEKHELSCLWRVIVTLYFDFVYVEAF